jgi:hypothetical protein
VPEKFRGQDEAATLDKMLKALQDAESALTQSNQERSQLQTIVSDLTRRPREEYRPQVQTQNQPETKKEDPEEDLDDSAYFDSPVQNTLKLIDKRLEKRGREIAREESTKTVQHYDTFATRRAVLERFKETHSDFDNFKNEIVEVCRMHPEWDNDLNGLPKIYEAAKTLAIAKAQSLTRPTNTSNQTVDVDKLRAEIKAEVEASAVEKARQGILDEIRRRRAASGILSSNATNVSDRVNSPGKTAPLSPEDTVLDEMIKSGPKSLGI